MLDIVTMLALTAAMVAMSANPATLQNASPQTPIANAFIRNNGQWDPEARFLARSGGLDFWVTRTGFTLDFHRIAYGENTASKQGHVVQVEVVGSTGTTAANGVIELPGVINYLNGSQENWVSNVPRFAEAQSVGLLPNVDARFYFDKGMPRYDMVVRPGANPNSIKLAYTGAKNLRAENNVLRYETTFGTVEEQGLFVYQKVNGTIKPVSAKHVVNADGTVSFQLGAYDSSKALIIDPVIWSTYLGGTANDQPKRNIVDGTGAHYVTGTTLAADFPTTAGAYDLAINGASDAFVTKLAADGSSLVYSTYVGGTGSEEGNGLAVSNSGTVTFVGRTTSGATFPQIPPAATPLSAGGGVDDAFIATINAAGTALTFASKLGGSLHDQANNVVLNNTTATVVGETTSTNYPARTTNPDIRPFQFSNGGGQDAFITEVNLDTRRVSFSTYVGGAGTETATDVLLLSGLPIAIGTTTGTFTAASYAAKPGFDKTANGGTDAWLLGVGSGYASVSFWSLYGGTNNESAGGFYRASDGALFMAGTTNSGDLPIVLGYQSALFGFGGGYMAKFTGDTSTLTASTFYRGSTGDVSIADIQADPLGAPVVIGRSAARDLKLGGMDADRTRRGGSDVFVSRFSPALNVFWHGTYLGGNNDDWASSLAMFGTTAVASGWTNSSILPNTAGKAQPALAGGNDGFLASVTLPVSFTQFNAYAPISPYRWPFDVRTDAGVYADTVVTFTSDNAKFPLPASVTIPRGSNKSATLSVTPTPAGSIQMDEVANLSATSGATVLTQTVNIPAPVISTIAFDTTEQPAGLDVIATVNLASANPTLYIPVGLSLVDATTGDPIDPAQAFLHRSSVLTIPANEMSGVVYIRSLARNTDLSVKIKGPLGFMSDTVLLKKTSVSSVTLSRDTVKGGTSTLVTGTVRLSNRAPLGGTVVELDADTDAANVPASVTVPAGSTSATFTFNTDAVATDTLATVTGAANGTSASDTVTIQAPVLNNFVLDFPTRTVGTSQRARVYIDGNAPVGGMDITIMLVNPSTGVTVPATVNIPEGLRVSSSFLMPIDASIGTTPVMVTLRATLGTVSIDKTFTVN